MAKSSTTLKPGDNLPKRGKAAKTLILEAIRENSLLELKKGATKEDAEKAFFLHIAKSAFDVEDKDRNLCLSLLANKAWPNLKSSNDVVRFDFNDNAKPHEQASQVLAAISKAELAPDIGHMFIQSIKTMIDIEEYTILKERIELLEKAMNAE